MSANAREKALYVDCHDNRLREVLFDIVEQGLSFHSAENVFGPVKRLEQFLVNPRLDELGGLDRIIDRSFF
ncbi:MAG TPA: hypothetical protein VK582_09145 [Pyrinomonadaceae bacterium]|nr:hypothetical protein [Pyrinomonadaceae bacterium]